MISPISNLQSDNDSNTSRRPALKETSLRERYPCFAEGCDDIHGSTHPQGIWISRKPTTLSCLCKYHRQIVGKNNIFELLTRQIEVFSANDQCIALHTYIYFRGIDP